MPRDVFAHILGQPQVRDFLRTSVRSGHFTHAYLFCGPPGSNKTQAAYALASAILCEDYGCGTCDTCRSILARKHPDVRYFAPEGAKGYLVDQVREIVADTSLAPIQAKYKIYIIDRVDLMFASAANAFLKTLEEPPSDVVMILLGRTRDSVLSTIVSRCQVVPFRRIPAEEAAGIVVQNSGSSRDLAKIALEACGGSITHAIEFLQSNERLAFRTKVLSVMDSLRDADDWDILEMASNLVLLSKAPLDTVRARQEAELAENADFLAKSAMRQIEARNKRALTAKSFESLNQLTAIITSFLRDLSMVSAGVPQLIINIDVRDQIVRAAQDSNLSRLVDAFAAVRRCEEAISYNVSPETCLGALLLEIREALYGAHSAD